MRNRSIVTIGVLVTAAMASTSAAAGTLSLKELREEGVVIQKWDVSCGAAALATVLTLSLDDPVSEIDVVQGLLRETTPLKVRYRHGFSLRDMKNYAEGRGYRAVGFRGLKTEDIRYFDGTILPLRTHGYSHYVVFNGMTSDGRVRVADPAFGNRTLSKTRFERAWMNGLAFVIYRSAN